MKECLIKADVFFNLLSLHKVNLTEKDQKQLSQMFNGSNGRIKYKEALQQVYIDTNQVDALKEVWHIRGAPKQSRAPFADDMMSIKSGKNSLIQSRVQKNEKKMY